MKKNITRHYDYYLDLIKENYASRDFVGLLEGSLRELIMDLLKVQAIDHNGASDILYNVYGMLYTNYYQSIQGTQYDYTTGYDRIASDIEDDFNNMISKIQDAEQKKAAKEAFKQKQKQRTRNRIEGFKDWKKKQKFMQRGRKTLKPKTDTFNKMRNVFGGQDAGTRTL